jgi:hypothetical protein
VISLFSHIILSRPESMSPKSKIKLMTRIVCLAEVSSWVPSMAVTGLLHKRGSHLGRHSCSGKTQAYFRPVVSKGSSPCHVFVSKFFQRTHTGGQVFHAQKCFSIGAMP